MKSTILAILAFFYIVSSVAANEKDVSSPQVTLKKVKKKGVAQASNKGEKKKFPSSSVNREPAQARKKSRPQSKASTGQTQLRDATALYRQGNFVEAAPRLYQLSRRAEFQSDRAQIKFLLGNALEQLNLKQVAAFQYVDIIRNSETDGSSYLQKAIERLSSVADELGDDTLLNYAISKVTLSAIPEDQRDMISFRLGEIKMRNAQFAESLGLFAKVDTNGAYGHQALFNRGLVLLELNRPSEALGAFRALRKLYDASPVTEANRVNAQMAIARTYYQMQDWDRALEAYREIPRDSEQWHDALFEKSWAELRAAKFRSVLSSMVSLHSAFYEQAYIPESLLVRSIVYLYICRFEETEKTLNLFDRQYSTAKTQLTKFLNSGRDPNIFFNEIEKAYQISQGRKAATTLRIPYMMSRSVLREGNVKRAFTYLNVLASEKSRIESLGQFAKTSLGVYAQKVLAGRFRNAKITTGEVIKVHLENMRSDLNDFFEQAALIRYETINGKKELIKKRIAGKDAPAVDEERDRTFYVQNGYEYWPFQGEYWIDEVGNYHYLGTQSCQ